MSLYMMMIYYVCFADDGYYNDGGDGFVSFLQSFFRLIISISQKLSENSKSYLKGTNVFKQRLDCLQ